MRLLTVFLALAASVFAQVQDVSGTDAFNNLVKKNPLVMAAFTAPWCGHCKKLKPEYEKAAEALKGEPVVMINVDATADDNKDVAAKYGVRGYPTIKVFYNHDLEKPMTFEGSRDEAGLVQYLKRLSGPASKLQKDKATVTEITQRETSIIAVFPGGEKSPEYKTYSAAADDLRSEVDLYHVTDASLLGDHCKKDCKNAKIFVFKTFDEPVMSVELKGMSKAQIKEFLDKATRPVVLELENIPRFRKYTSKVYDDKVRSKVIFYTAPETKEAVKAAIAEVQGRHPDCQFLLSPHSNPKSMGFFGLVEANLPAFAIHQVAPDDKKYAELNVPPTAEAFEAFINKYKEGQLLPFLKSEPVPASNDGPVKVLVGKTFMQEVFRSGKDVLMEAYAPWCGHCKKLAPVYDALGAKYANDPEISITKIDATANDIPSPRMEANGYPTLYFYKHKTGDVIRFEGDRSEEGLSDFIEKNRSNPKTGKDEL